MSFTFPGLAACAAALLALAPAAMADDRRISGELTYGARIALPEDAHVLVETRAPDGRILGTYRAPAGGAQVPVGFDLKIPPGTAGTLRAAFARGGQVDWVSGDVAIPAGSEDLTLPEIVMQRHVPLAFESRLTCGGRDVHFGVLGQSAVMEIDRRRLLLVPEETASGSRFADPQDSSTWIWTKGDTARLSLAGEELPECRLAVPETRMPYRAQGNEPFWTLGIDGGEVTLTRVAGSGETRFALPQPGAEGTARVFRRTGEPAVEFRIAARLCRDSMTGMPYPDTVSVLLGDDWLEGCGGAPYELLQGGTWQIEGISGLGIVEDSDVHIVFLDGRRATGRTGCNRFNAAVDLTGETFGFGDAAVTKMACPEALMAQEQRFVEALGSVQGFDIDPAGALLLTGDYGRVLLRARRQ